MCIQTHCYWTIENNRGLFFVSVHYGILERTASAIDAISILSSTIFFFYYSYELVSKLKGCILPPGVCCLNRYKANCHLYVWNVCS
jgi:hypothetical protein